MTVQFAVELAVKETALAALGIQLAAEKERADGWRQSYDTARGAMAQLEAERGDSTRLDI